MGKKRKIVFEGDPQIDRDMNAVVFAMHQSEGLEVEVICWALYAMQANPKLTVEEAIMEGYNEWVK